MISDSPSVEIRGWMGAALAPTDVATVTSAAAPIAMMNLDVARMLPPLMVGR